ncbi:hypothetical protein OA848_05040 [Rickettsiales bacterium]|nr:hypothetical protein [Rickettsiales bacterium]
MSKIIIIRTCCNSNSGGGHLLRCLALSKILSKRNKILLYCPDANTKILNNVINNEEISLINYDNIKDLKDSIDLCILDDYRINNSEILFFRSRSKKIIIIDEHITENEYADLIINLTLPNTLERKSIKPILTDLKYSLVDSCYSEIAKNFKVKKNVQRILINFGLLDNKSMTLNILELIESSNYPFNNFKFDILISSLNKNLSQIKTLSKSSKIDFNLCIDNFNISNILKKSDLVIGSGGLSLLERLTVGVPSITFPISENQNLVKEKIHKLNCTYFIAEELMNDFIEIMMKLINNYKLREKMSKLARIKFDGKGALRVATIIEKKLI